MTMSDNNHQENEKNMKRRTILKMSGSCIGAGIIATNTGASQDPPNLGASTHGNIPDILITDNSSSNANVVIQAKFKKDKEIDNHASKTNTWEKRIRTKGANHPELEGVSLDKRKKHIKKTSEQSPTSSTAKSESGRTSPRAA